MPLDATAKYAVLIEGKRSCTRGTRTPLTSISLPGFRKAREFTKKVNFRRG